MEPSPGSLLYETIKFLYCLNNSSLVLLLEVKRIPDTGALYIVFTTVSIIYI